MNLDAATFGADLAFLKAHTETIVLSDPAHQAQVLLAPTWQGRVMTSTSQGDNGASYGWINRKLIASKTIQPHINVFGGEDRFWLGPEGGQYSIFFAKDVSFDLDHWFTPAALDTEPFEVVKQSRAQARFQREFSVTNYSGTVFQVGVDREVRLLTPKQVSKHLGIETGKGVSLVGYESRNRLSNRGQNAWTQETGLLSIWILGMFNHSPTTTIVVPIKPGPESELGKPVNSDYFGVVPPDRLAVREGVVYFRGDGQARGKIGISPRRAKPILGSYDAQNRVLTLVQFSLPEGAAHYVNSMWKLQADPYAGDVANSYNDGPPEPGVPALGPFYELESSSPAAALKPGKKLEHIHRTVHLQGDEDQLDPIARKVLGAGLAEIVHALPQR